MTTTVSDEQFEIFCNDADLKTPERAARDLRRMGLQEAAVDTLVERYEKHVGVIRHLDSPRYMASTGRISWYTGPRPKDPCWPTLEQMLRDQGFSDHNIQLLDESTSRIVSLLEHPAREPFKTKGLGPGPRAVGQDDELHRRHGQGGRSGLSTRHRASRYPQ